jgi:hypothetical protein
MNPTSVRSTLPGRASSAAMIWSMPGAVKPVQLATIRWVMPASMPAPSAAIACSASFGASSLYTAMRAPVLGAAPW